VGAINIFELLNSSPCVEDHVTLEQEEMAGEALRRLRNGTFYDNVPARAMLDPKTHPRGEAYEPEVWGVYPDEIGGEA
jgi:hypothetical protein